MVGVRLQPAALSELDTWRVRRADAPSRPEAIRRLIELGMAAEAQAETDTNSVP